MLSTDYYYYHHRATAEWDPLFGLNGLASNWAEWRQLIDDFHGFIGFWLSDSDQVRDQT